MKLDEEEWLISLSRLYQYKLRANKKNTDTWNQGKEMVTEKKNRLGHFQSVDLEFLEV